VSVHACTPMGARRACVYGAGAILRGNAPAARFTQEVGRPVQAACFRRTRAILGAPIAAARHMFASSAREVKSWIIPKEVHEHRPNGPRIRPACCLIHAID